MLKWKWFLSCVNSEGYTVWKLGCNSFFSGLNEYRFRWLCKLFVTFLHYLCTHIVPIFFFRRDFVLCNNTLAIWWIWFLLFVYKMHKCFLLCNRGRNFSTETNRGHHLQNHVAKFHFWLSRYGSKCASWTARKTSFMYIRIYEIWSLIFANNSWSFFLSICLIHSWLTVG